jgi:hypothetical protein
MNMGLIPKGWASALKPLGFQKRGNLFVRSRDGVEQSIFTKRKLHEELFQIWVTVGVIDPYAEDQAQYLFFGYICRSGIHFLEYADAWWPKTELSAAIGAVTTYGANWLDSHYEPEVLVRDVEACLAANQGWHQFFEKRPEAVPAEKTLFYFASLLHMRLGDRVLSCQRARQWYEHMKGVSWGREPERTLRQMKDLGCDELTGIRIRIN